MSQMYVGNATRQIYDFCYKVPENQKLFSQKIHPGTFQKIALANLTKPDIDYIIAQHAKYGLIAEDEIDRAKEILERTGGEDISSTRESSTGTAKPDQKARRAYGGND